MFMHGGGYYRGSVAATRATVAKISAEAKVKCLSINYRLAPEHQYPSQLEDGVACFETLINEFDYSPQQIAFGGDSAGGNLALVTLLKLKEKNKKLPAAVMCMSPWADPAATGDTYNIEMCDKDPVLGPTFKKVFQKYGLDAYLTYYVKDEDMDSENPFICPINGDFTGSPPIMIHVGKDELLLSDSRNLIAAFERDNVIYEYKEWDELWHVFQMESYMPESRKSFEQFSDFLNKYVGAKV